MAPRGRPRGSRNYGGRGVGNGRGGFHSTEQSDLEYEAMQKQIEELFQRVAPLERNDFERALEENEKACPFVDDGLCLGPAMIDTQTVRLEVDSYPFNMSEDNFDGYVDLIGDPIFDTYDDEEEYKDSNPTQHSLFQQSVMDNQKDLSFSMEFGKQFFFPFFDYALVVKNSEMLKKRKKAAPKVEFPKFWSDVFDEEFESKEAVSKWWLGKRTRKIILLLGGESKQIDRHIFGRVIEVLALQAWPFDPGIPMTQPQLNKTRGRVFFKRGRMMQIKTDNCRNRLDSFRRRFTICKRCRNATKIARFIRNGPRNRTSGYATAYKLPSRFDPVLKT